MDSSLTTLLQQLLNGTLSVDDAARQIEAERPAILSPTAAALVDISRRERCGYPEVVFAPGKSPQAIADVFEKLQQHGQPRLATRVNEEQARFVLGRFPNACYNPLARTLRDGLISPPAPSGWVAIITAGTGDRPVAEEASETAQWMGARVTTVIDVGVAGPHRLPARLAEFQQADAIVVAAGMEAALPSVVGGYVPCPVIAVPTSIGYGASFGGVAALLGMLNSCAANVTVVNIDAGFKAGFLAGLIAQRLAAARAMTASP